MTMHCIIQKGTGSFLKKRKLIPVSIPMTNTTIIQKSHFDFNSQFLYRISQASGIASGGSILMQLRFWNDCFRIT